jgi:hypothetical protein
MEIVIGVRNGYKTGGKRYWVNIYRKYHIRRTINGVRTGRLDLEFTSTSGSEIRRERAVNVHTRHLYFGQTK